MRRPTLILFILLFISQIVIAQNATDIVGRWQSAHGNGQIQIYKKADLFFGKIAWLSEPNDEAGNPKRDIKNPTKNLQSRPIIGLEVLKDFRYKGQGVWTNGEIYDPKSGNTYNCQMTLIGPNKLNIRAFFGLNILGRTETWTRVDNK
jgi:uncharacterized protein (DUF2147 family)